MIFVGHFYPYYRNNQDYFTVTSLRHQLFPQLCLLVKQNEYNPSLLYKACSRKGDEIFHQSFLPPYPPFCCSCWGKHFPAVHWETRRIGVALWGLATYIHVVWYKNRLYFKSFMTMNASDLHEKTKSGTQDRCMTNLDLKSSGALFAFLSKLYPGFVWPRGWCCLCKHCGLTI